MMCCRVVPGFGVELRNRHASGLVFPFALDNYHSVQCSQSDRQVRNHRADARISREQAVILVFTMPRITSVAALLQAKDVPMPVVPAARMLREVATDRRHVADLARADLRGRLLQ